MKHTYTIALFLSMTLPVWAQNAKPDNVVIAQDRLSVEIRSGIAFATKDLSEGWTEFFHL